MRSRLAVHSSVMPDSVLDPATRFVRSLRAEVWLPSTVFAGAVIVQLAIARPSAFTKATPSESRLHHAWRALSGAKPTQLWMLVAALLIVALLLQPFSSSLTSRFAVQPRHSFVRWLLMPMLRLQRRRWASLRAAAAGPSLADPDASNRSSTRTRILAELYPDREDEVLPTLLGNALLSVELRAGRPYGISWPALGSLFMAVADDGRGDPSADARAQLDLLASLSVALSSSAAVGIVVFWSLPLVWMVIPAGLLLVAFSSYRAAVRSVTAYALGLQLVVELRRFDVLRALHLPLPTTQRQEREMFRALSGGGDLSAWSYQHGSENAVSPTAADAELTRSDRRGDDDGAR